MTLNKELFDQFSDLVETIKVDEAKKHKSQTESLIKQNLDIIISLIADMNLDDKVSALNEVKLALHKISPHRDEPTDGVIWVKADSLIANEYNPNSVASTEMELLKLSIMSDGYTMPIVAWQEDDGTFQIIDGFHRSRCGKEVGKILKRVHGYLPISIANSERTSKEDRVASTIRHNRARGVHSLQIMSDIVVDLVRRKKTDEWIAKELGMCKDEVLRLKQTAGLAELFVGNEFSQAWEVDFVEDGIDKEE